ncbi:MAG: LysM peptidoglycan-binding domain-containing protein [Chloroflexi bacterium]|nr:LysM peptidoglycan-binding domain-containing protein [Chloroflexota bacterium]
MALLVLAGLLFLAPQAQAVGYEEAEAASHDYEVRPGDTLEGIASRFGLSKNAIAELNGLSNPNLIRIGQRLRLPTGEGLEIDAPRPRAERVQAPYRSQFDGSREEGANCGPATLSMFMGAFGEHWSIGGIRRSVNQAMGIWDPDGGSTWASLAYAARGRGFTVQGLYAAKGVFRKWSFNDLMAEVQAGRPVMLLVRFWSLPGHGESAWWGDHYILFLGLNADGDVLYHDSAFKDERGAYLAMTRDRLMRAWSRVASGIQYSAMALRW